jgi:hypothetical protein
MFSKFNPERVYRSEVQPALECGVAQVPMRFVSPDRIFLLSVWAWALYLRFGRPEASGSAKRNVEDQIFEHCTTPINAFIARSVGVRGDAERLGSRGVRHHLRPFFDLAVSLAGRLPAQHLSFSSGTFRNLVAQFPFFDTPRDNLLSRAGQDELKALGFAGTRLQAFLYERLTGLTIPQDQLPKSMDDLSDMVDVFVSYAHEDEVAANVLSAGLERRGRSVFIDARLAGSGAFNSKLTSVANEARVIVVLWSGYSVASRWVNAEALLGFDTHRLVNVMLEEVGVPLPFNSLRALPFRSRYAPDQELAAIDLAVEEILGGFGAR